jgi:lysozyme
MTVSCIDISHHQGKNIDFAQVRKSGVVAMIHKATEGSSFIDDMRESNIIAATKAGIACCTYHWLSPGSNVKSQMDFYLDIVIPVRGERLVIDYEQDGCTLSGLKEAVQYLLDQKMDYQITVYSGHLLKEHLGSKKDEFLAENTDLWLAQYTSGTPSWSDETYPNWTLWQYSDTGRINGINDAYVDLNRFDGTDKELVEWISPKGSDVRPEPEPEPVDEVVIDITAPEGVTVTVKVNGVEVS